MARYSPWYDGCRFPEYWKFEDHSHRTTGAAKRELIKRGFFAQKSIGRDRCIALLARADRGYLSYEKYEKAELRQFCGSRSLELATKRTASKADLVAALEEADDTWTFPLMDLPPELRLEIYAHHFAAYKHLEEANITPPPVTTACRQVRTEALPLFYDTHSFLFDASLFRDSATINFVPATTNITSRLLDSNFLLIRKIHLRLFAYNSATHESETTDCKIDLGGKHTAASITECSSMIPDLGRRYQEEISTTTRVSSILNGLSTRFGGKALRRTDIEVLFQALYPGGLRVVTNMKEGDA
ncbi:hypothetical protein LTR17_012640 [Elasticomyces elasticus]|nr:hypothetical protein LTR17_012640 [Elasticomyces elasticus]